MKWFVTFFTVFIAQVVGAEESDVLQLMAMKPAVADALEQKFISGVEDADAAQLKLGDLIRGRTVTTFDEFSFDRTVPDRQWLRNDKSVKPSEVMPGWVELEGGEMSCLFGEEQVLDFFAKLTTVEKKTAHLREIKTKTPAANGHFVYARWDDPDEESHVFLSRALRASTESLLFVKVQQYRFRTEKDRDDFAQKVEGASPEQKEKAATYLKSKADLVQGVTVISAEDQEVRISNRMPVAYEIEENIFEHRDAGLRFDLGYETNDDKKTLSVFYLDAGLTGKKKEHDTGEKIPEFFTGHYSDELDFSKDATIIVPFFHSHSAGADMLLIKLLHFK